MKADLAEHPEKDLGRAFELYRDSGGRRINLADWAGAFGQGPGAKARSRAPQTHTRRAEARFLRAVGDLGVIGFVAPEKRRAEHVARTVW